MHCAIASANAAPLPHLNDLIAGTNQQKMAADILAIGCNQFPLSGSVKAQHCFTAHGSRIELAQAVDMAVAVARHDIIENHHVGLTSNIQNLANKVAFKIATPVTANEALALYDFMVNRTITMHLLKSLKRLINEDRLNKTALATFSKEAETQANRDIEGELQEALYRLILQELESTPHATTIVYASIGCGSATKDIRSIKTLQTLFPKHTVAIYCLDPYQQQEGHPVARIGTLDIIPLKKDEQLLPRLHTVFDKSHSIFIATGHYAFHHLGQSFELFRQTMGGIPTILYESGVTENWFHSFTKRQRTISYDLLMNYGFDHIHKSQWVSSAAEENPDYFQVHYPNIDVLKTSKTSITSLNSGKKVLIQLNHRMTD